MNDAASEDTSVSQLIVLTASFEVLLQQIIVSLHQEFSITHLGSLNYFLGISVTHDSLGMFLSQRKYVVEIERAHMVNCNPSRTHVDTESRLGDVVQQLFSSSTTSFVAYLDADWAGYPTTHAEAEYRGVANAVVETYWLRNLLRELHTPLSSATLVYCDNGSAIYLSYKLYGGTSFSLRLAFWLCFACRVLHVPSRYQYANFFTSGLPSALFEEFRTSLSVRCSPAQTAREC
ncbi:ribonuclease H-like domain-containing protein [Tanacetum coccineum]